MSTLTFNPHPVIENLPAGGIVILPDFEWDDYEDLLEEIGENRSVRTSYCDGRLQIIVVSSEHENYAWFIGRLMNMLDFRLRLNTRFFGAPTMKKAQRRKGLEPDACFYVQSAPLIGNRVQLDFAVDPPPDVAVEIDIHHGSLPKFPIYAALGVPEIWRYDGRRLTIHLLEGEQYVESSASRSLPMLTESVLTDALTRLKEEGELAAVVAFDEWLQSARQ